MRPLLFDETIQRNIDVLGFSLAPRLKQVETDALLALFNGSRNNYVKDNTFQSTNMLETDAQRMHDFKGIERILAPYLSTQFDSYKVVMPNFLYKPPGPEGGVFHLHQDWSYVDEEKYYSINLWIPLVDVTAANGAMHMVPNSHKFDNRVRGRNIWWPYWDFKEEIIEKSCKPINMKAGEVLLHNNKMLHYTSPNNSPTERIAVSLIITFSEAEVMVYFGKDGNLFKATGGDDFYIKHGVFDQHFDADLNPVLLCNMEQYNQRTNVEELRLKVMANETYGV